MSTNLILDFSYGKVVVRCLTNHITSSIIIKLCLHTEFLYISSVKLANIVLNSLRYLDIKYMIYVGTEISSSNRENFFFK